MGTTPSSSHVPWELATGDTKRFPPTEFSKAIVQAVRSSSGRLKSGAHGVIFSFAACLQIALADDAPIAQPEWIVAEGLELRTDAVGFEYPVGIGLLHRPGPNPADVKYIVTQLRGGILAVLNSGEVVSVATDEDTFKPEQELPWGAGESGQVGACLSPDDGYLFTTSAVSMGWVRVNRITKWRSTGKPPWHRIVPVAVFQKPLQHDPTAASHQIGHCKVDADGKLWVGTGDGNIPETTHLVDHANGKVLRLNLDFSAPRDNPYYDDGEPEGIASYVWSMGLRNPFALAQVGGVTHVADNGIAIDRLLRLEKGKDFPWDKTDASMTYDNLMTFPQGLGPADMVYVPHGHPLTVLNGHLVILASHKAQIVAVPYDLHTGVKGSPRVVVEPALLGDRVRDFAGAALAPDGLYVSHIRINGAKGPLPSEVFKLVPGEAAPEEVTYSAAQLIDAHACRGCHRVGGVGESKVGPNLDEVEDRVRARLQDGEYLKRLAELLERADQSSPHRWKRAYEQILDERASPDERVRWWIETKVLDPRFDDPSTAMPESGLGREDAQKIAEYLLVAARGIEEGASSGTFANRFKLLKRQVGREPGIPVFVALVLGLALGLASAGIAGRLRRRRKRPTSDLG